MKTTVKIKIEQHMDKIHNKLFEQIMDINNICQKNNIDYSLIAGTLLGAIRHNDFIPWDDDVDIVMTRYNFEKFDKIYNIQKSAYLEYDNKDWIKKVYHKEKLFIDDIAIDNICTDIFIIDNTPDVNSIRKFKVLALKILQGMMKKKPNYKEYNFFGKIASFITHIIGRFFTDNFKVKIYNFVSKIGNNKNTKNVWYYNAAYAYLNFYIDRKVFDQYESIDFRGVKLRKITYHHEYLKLAYGKDYLTPPDANGRIPHHIIEI